MELSLNSPLKPAPSGVSGNASKENDEPVISAKRKNLRVTLPGSKEANAKEACIHVTNVIMQQQPRPKVSSGLQRQVAIAASEESIAAKATTGSGTAASVTTKTVVVAVKTEGKSNVCCWPH